MRRAILLVAVGCSSAPAVHARHPDRAPADWSVAFERSIGVLATAPVFAPDGSVTSSGQRFDRDGRYLGLLALEVGGGRMIANVRALLSDGRGLAQTSGDGELLLLGRADRPPEEATRRQTGWIGAVAVSPDQRRAAAIVQGGIQIWSLPGFEPAETIALEGDSSAEALAFVAGGGLAYATACRGAGCSGAGLEMLSATGGRRRLRDGGIDALAIAEGAAVIASGATLEVLALPDGAPRGRIRLPGPVAGGWSPAGALAVSGNGRTVAAVVCDQLLVFAASGGGWRRAYQGRIAHPSGEDRCAYPSGLAFAPDGKSLALADRDLTVLRQGSPRPPIEIAYRPRVPDGFQPSDEVDGVYMPPAGTGLAPAPRVIGSWSGDAQTRVVVREAAEMSRFRDLDGWATALLTRFEPMVRDDMQPNRIADKLGDALPRRRAFVDPRGRRVLEYTLLVRGGCEEMDRHVRWIEDGAALVEIDVESVPGVDPSRMRRWLTAFFDAPLGSALDQRRRIASAAYNRGPC